MKPAAPATSRITAAIIALCTWTSLAVQFAATYSLLHSTLSTLWILAAYFTILTNLLVAIVFTCISLRIAPAPSILAGTTLSILLVGVVYGLLLHGTVELNGAAAVANILTHMITPAAVVLYWIVLAPKGALTWRDPLLWAIYPLAYLGYGLTRGSATGKYAYPFLDAARLGLNRALLNASIIAVAFMLCAFAVVFIDRLLRRPAPL